MIKKLILSLFGMAAIAATAATVTLTWTNSTNAPIVKIYAQPGANMPFLNNSNYTVYKIVTNTTTTTISNMSPGAWTFSATASDTNGLESAFSATAWTNLYDYPNPPTLLKVTGTTPQ